MGGRHMPTQHLPAPAAIQADDMIAMNGSPDGNSRGSLDDGFSRRLTEFPERLMDGRDQGGELVGRELIASNIGGDNFRGEVGLLRIGHRSVPPSFEPQDTIPGEF